MNLLRQLVVCGGFLVVLSQGIVPEASAETVSYSLYASEDSMLWNPDSSVEAKWQDAASRNFGTINSRHIASATSHAPGKLPRGIFESVIRFDAATMVEELNTAYGTGNWSIDSITLHLMTSDNVAGPGIFNAPGTAGKFMAAYMPVDGGWKQGTGYKDPNYPGNYGADGGATYNSVHATLASSPAVYLSTFDFVRNGVLSPADYPDLGSANSDGKADLLDALMDGDAVSLLIQAADNQVAFNFTSQSYGTSPMYDPTLIFSITAVPEPTMLGLMGMGGLVLSRRKSNDPSTERHAGQGGVL